MLCIQQCNTTVYPMDTQLYCMNTIHYYMIYIEYGRWNDGVYVGGTTHQNKFGGKSGGDQYIVGPP